MQEAASAYIDAIRGGWKHQKYEPRLRQLVRDHFGALAERPVQTVNLEDVLKAVKPLMETKPSTAKMMISFLNSVIAWASAHKHRDPSLANPASWEGVLRFVMQKPHAGGNYSSMPNTELPTCESLRAIDNVYARGCEFTILVLVAKR